MPAADRPGPITIEQARRELAQAFVEHGLDTPQLDARLLVGHALRLDHAALAARATQALTTAERETIAALAARRLEHEPVARIIGQKEFWGLPLALNGDTLVPRPETETVVEAALAAIDHGPGRSQPLRLLDLGTGTGALLLALLSELPAAYGIGTDISLAALACARRNAAALGLMARCGFVACDFGAALSGPFDLIVANPPYIARGDVDDLPDDVRLFDPRRALDGGPDGLDAYRAIAADGPRLLAPGGTLVVELGIGQRGAVEQLFAARGLAIEAVRHDLSNMERALPVRRPS
jgi:release factor glutamine methyltransferase